MDLMTFCSTQNPVVENLNGLRAMLMAFSDSIPVTSFFNNQGTPYTYRDICQMTRDQIHQIHIAASDGFSSEARNYLQRNDTTESIGRSIVTHAVVDRASGKKNQDDLLTTASKGYVSHQMGLAFGVAWIKFKNSRKLYVFRKNIEKKIQQEIAKWDAGKNTMNQEFPVGLHKVIKQACADTDSDSIKDVRVWVMKHHPRATARVLVHPSGRLLTEREICVALKIYEY